MLLPATEHVWHAIKTESVLAGFILIGGSALALRIQHRLSEDLDLVYCGETLPRLRLDRFLASPSIQQLSFQRNDNPAALDEFLQGGMNLHDYQQDFIANGTVKVSFFTGNTALCKVLEPGAESGVRLATTRELFESKCLVSALRSRTRDFLDLFLLLKHHNFGMADYLQAFRRTGTESQIPSSLTRLCSGIAPKGDEGYQHLLDSPPTLGEIAGFFTEFRDRVEQHLAEEFKRRSPE